PATSGPRTCTWWTPCRTRARASCSAGSCRPCSVSPTSAALARIAAERPPAPHRLVARRGGGLRLPVGPRRGRARPRRYHRGRRRRLDVGRAEVAALHGDAGRGAALAEGHGHRLAVNGEEDA